MSRPTKILLAVVGVALFLVISFGLARILAADGVESAAISDLIAAQARGDVAAMLEELEGCRERPECVRQVGENARTLRTDAEVQLLRVDSETNFTLGSDQGQARVAWRPAGANDPVIQCITVRRGGNVFTGPTVELLSISGELPNEGSCGEDG